MNRVPCMICYNEFTSFVSTIMTYCYANKNIFKKTEK